MVIWANVRQSLKATAKKAQMPMPAAMAGRLLDLELATVGALRSRQMDLEDDAGIPVETVLREARRVLKK